MSAEHPAVSDSSAATVERIPVCYGSCGILQWTVEKHGRVTHKAMCAHRSEPWCQSHPEGCPSWCVPVMWKEWASRV